MRSIDRFVPRYVFKNRNLVARFNYKSNDTGAEIIFTRIPRAQKEDRQRYFAR